MKFKISYAIDYFFSLMYNLYFLVNFINLNSLNKGVKLMTVFNRNSGHGNTSRVIDTHALQFEIQPSSLALGYRKIKGVTSLFYNFPGVKTLASCIGHSIGYQHVVFRGQTLCINWEQELLLNDFKKDAEHFLRKEFRTADGYEIHPQNGKFVVMARKGNTVMEVKVQTPELQGFLNQMQATWNEILKDNLYMFLQLNKGKLEELYANTLMPAAVAGRRGGAVNYNQAQAKARVAELLSERMRPDGQIRKLTAEEMFRQLKADGILSVTGGCLTSRASLRSLGIDLEKFSNLYQYLNEATPDIGLSESVGQNLAARMRHRRTRKIAHWLGPIPMMINLYACGKKVTRVYRWLWSKNRVQTESAVENLQSKWTAAERALHGVTPEEKSDARFAVENFKNGVPGAARPTARENAIYKADCTMNGLEVIQATDPDFALTKEVFRAYHEALYVVQHDPKKCGERMRRALSEMIDKLAVKRKASSGDGHRYRAGAPVTVTPEDKQQIYRLLAYVLPLEEQRISARSTVFKINDAILDEYLAIGEEDDDLCDAMLTEQDFMRVTDMQNALFDVV